MAPFCQPVAFQRELYRECYILPVFDFNAGFHHLDISNVVARAARALIFLLGSKVKTINIFPVSFARQVFDFLRVTEVFLGFIERFWTWIEFFC